MNARLANDYCSLWSKGSKLLRAGNVDLKRAQVTIVDANNACAQALSAVHILFAVDFGQDIHSQSMCCQGKLCVVLIVQNGQHQ